MRVSDGAYLDTRPSEEARDVIHDEWRSVGLHLEMWKLKRRESGGRAACKALPEAGRALVAREQSDGV